MFKSFFNTLVNCFKIEELKTRIFFTLGLLLVCRLISLIPVPGLDGQKLSAYFEDLSKKSTGADAGLLGMYSMFTGGALETCAIGSLGIMPYISATIILQLLGAVIPQLAKLAREEGGRAKLIQYGRYLTLLLCLGQGFAMSLGWENPEKIFGGYDKGVLVMADNLWWYRIQTTLILTTGTLLLMWLGEQITERGIGNGVSLVITIGILARLPQAGQSLFEMFRAVEKGGEGKSIFVAIVLLLMLLVVVGVVIAVTQAQREIPVQYAQRAVGRKVYAGGSSFMPLRVNYAGVMPIIFAQAILMFPQKILELLGKSFELQLLISLGDKLSHGTVGYLVFEALMILFFSYFWVATQFNETQIADDLKKYGGYIPGVRPGGATSDFLHHAMSRITLAGAIFLMAIAVFPAILSNRMDVNFAVAQFLGGTSILITVGVMLDTMRQVESHLLMRHYDGFLKKGRIKGRS